jgi:UDP-N-acetyl-D-glucosamine/UDP-N-acetyl-D-galactosamine dehydrogenase
MNSGHYGADVDVYDPWVDKDEAREVYGIEPVEVCVAGAYDAVVLCVGHEDFKVKGFAWVASLGKETSVLYDVKNLLPVGLIDGWL